MKVAVISDIHGNYDAFSEVLKACEKEGVQEYLFLGDYIGYYYDAKKVWNIVKKLSNHIIKGNHEDLLKDLEVSTNRKEEIIKSIVAIRWHLMISPHQIKNTFFLYQSSSM